MIEKILFFSRFFKLKVNDLNEKLKPSLNFLSLSSKKMKKAETIHRKKEQIVLVIKNEKSPQKIQPNNF